jgi:Glycosyltransferase family 87
MPLNTPGVLGHDAVPATRVSTEGILRWVFIALFLQLQILAFASLVSQTPLRFVQKIRLQLDFQDFYQAAVDWTHGVNPYLRLDQFQYHRFNKPAPILWIILPLTRFSEPTAAYIFYSANLLAIAIALWGICRYFQLSRSESRLLFGIGSMFFPLIFVAERGNLDSFMLMLVVLALLFKNPIVKGLVLGLSVALKLYTALLLVPLTVNRRWKQATTTLAVCVALFLSCYPLFASFLQAQMARSAEAYLVENISPAALATIFGSYAESRVFKLTYLALWLLSYLRMLVRHRRSSLDVQTIYSLPWMMAMPFLVLPYTGILLLPVLALRSREIAARGLLTAHDYLFLGGFLLVGVQPLAMTDYFMWLTHSHRFFYALNPLGMTIIIGSITFDPAVREEACRESLQREASTRVCSAA